VGMLLLAACDDDWTAEIPKIAEKNLVSPIEVAGQYWALDVDKDNLNAWQGVWRWGKGKQGVIDGQGSEMRVRLVDLIDSEVRLLVTENDLDKDISTYYVMYPVENGILRVDHIDVPYGNAVTKAAAARHGFTFADDGDTLKGLEENFPGEAIPALFRDPEFLGTLSFRPASYFLPVGKPDPDPDVHIAQLPIGTEKALSITLEDDVAAGTMSGWHSPEDLDGLVRVTDFGDVLGWSELLHRGSITIEHDKDDSLLLGAVPYGSEQQLPFARIKLATVPLSLLLELEDLPDGRTQLKFRGQSKELGNGLSITFLLDGEEVELAIGEDGLFLLDRPGTDGPAQLDRTELEGILARGVFSDQFGIYEKLDDDEGEEGRRPKVVMLSTLGTNGCWWLATLQEKPASGSAQLNSLRHSLMQDAATAHGLDYQVQRLHGAKSLVEFLPLILDDRFSHGTKWEGVVQLCAHSRPRSDTRSPQQGGSQ